MTTPPKAPCHSCNGTGIDPTVGFLDCEFCSPAFAGVSLSAPEQPEPKCETCNDHGEIGCLRPDGYDGERCPDCNPATVKRYYVGKYGLVEGEALGRLSVVLGADHDRVTAERDAALGREAALQEELKVSMLDHKNTTDAGARAMAERDALQQRLTAADERADTATSLIRRIVANFDTEIECHEDVEPNELEHDQVLAEMREFLGAPVVAWDYAAPGTESYTPAAQPEGYPEGKREHFQKWVLATKHPVYGFLDGRSLARGDDRTGYADEYVQGLWVAYLAFGVERPAPAAAVTECGACPGCTNGCRVDRESPPAPTAYDGFDNGVD